MVACSAEQGVDVTDGELMEYISESSMMSKALVEYEGACAGMLTRLECWLECERCRHARPLCTCTPACKHTTLSWLVGTLCRLQELRGQSQALSPR